MARRRCERVLRRAVAADAAAVHRARRRDPGAGARCVSTRESALASRRSAPPRRRGSCSRSRRPCCRGIVLPASRCCSSARSLLALLLKRTGSLNLCFQVAVLGAGVLLIVVHVVAGRSGRALDAAAATAPGLDGGRRAQDRGRPRRDGRAVGADDVGSARRRWRWRWYSARCCWAAGGRLAAGRAGRVRHRVSEAAARRGARRRDHGAVRARSGDRRRR